MTGLDSSNVTGDTTTDDDQVVIYCSGKRISAIASGKKSEPLRGLREVRDSDVSIDLPASEAKPRFEWPMKIMGVTKLLGIALEPAWRKADRGEARGKTARNITKRRDEKISSL